MSIIFRSVLLILLSIACCINAFLPNTLLQIDGQNIQNVKNITVDSYVCNNDVNITYDQKLLRIRETWNKNFTVLLHPNLTGIKTVDTFLQSMRCYFGNISFLFVNFKEDPSVENMNYGVCDAFNKISNREDRSLRPLVVVFPAQTKLFSSKEPYLSNKAYPPCTQFQTDAMTIQATIQPDGFVNLFIRSNVADFVIKSSPDCPTLFDSIAAIMNPSMHSEFHFPYRPHQLSITKAEDEIEKWHPAAIAAVGIVLVLMFVVPSVVVWGRVKARQRQRDLDKKLREARLEGSKAEQLM